MQAWTDFMFDCQAEHLAKKRRMAADLTRDNGATTVKTYTLHIQEEDTVVQRPNLKYATQMESYERAKKMYDSFAKKNNAGKKEEDKGGDDDENLFLKPPKKTIEIIVTQKHVEREFMTQTSRDMSTLFLREEDEHHLRNCLYTFRTQKGLMRHLGLPNKLGVMLHGLPGTGKSSTVSAIASYLEKDVYYLQLDKVQDNDELKLLFEFVFQKCSEGGIIVMEDVDAMTDVVKRRHGGQDTSSPITTHDDGSSSGRLLSGRRSGKSSCSSSSSSSSDDEDASDVFSDCSENSAAVSTKKTRGGGKKGKGAGTSSAVALPMTKREARRRSQKNKVKNNEKEKEKRRVRDDYKRERDDTNKNRGGSKVTLEFLLNLLQGSLTLDGTVFIATTNHLEVLDPAFYRKGRFDVSIEMRPSNSYQVERIFRKFFSRCPTPDLLAQVPDDVYSPAALISHFSQYVVRERALLNSRTDQTIHTTFEEADAKASTTPDIHARDVEILAPFMRNTNTTRA
jgi:SpoVK/Ycf46/Vps4 family AAA+-type ATPase